jgi:hypothetical protein
MTGGEIHIQATDDGRYLAYTKQSPYVCMVGDTQDNAIATACRALDWIDGQTPLGMDIERIYHDNALDLYEA